MALLPLSRNQFTDQGALASKASGYTSRKAFPPIPHAGIVGIKINLFGHSRICETRTNPLKPSQADHHRQVLFLAPHRYQYFRFQQ